jgi:hypothetical protein
MKNKSFIVALFAILLSTGSASLINAYGGGGYRGSRDMYRNDGYRGGRYGGYRGGWRNGGGLIGGALTTPLALGADIAAAPATALGGGYTSTDYPNENYSNYGSSTEYE